MKLNSVFTPGRIGTLELNNRLVVSAMSSHLGNPDGTPNEDVNRYLEAKARGEWGLIFTEDLGVTVDAGSDPIVGSLWSDDQIPAWTETVNRVHAAGGLIGAQLYHAGRERALKAYDTHPVAPSAIKEPSVAYVPRALETEEVEDLVKAFAAAAVRAKKCGFDCIELHGAHGYLINQFMSPFANKRCDKYGGTIINRMRFPLEIIAAIKEAVGPDYPITFRMNTSDNIDGGLSLQEAIIMAKMLEDAGIDALNLSQGTFASKHTMISPSMIPAMSYVDNAAAIKASVNIPVIAVGRFNDVYMAESVLRDGKADFIAMARASLADPELPKKAKEGRVEEIIHCVGCNQGCTGETAKGNKVNCLANPHTCKETVYDLTPVDNPKKVFIAGAGVSGLAAAYGAAERGHKVTVFEASNEIGGQWLAASMPPGKTDFLSLLVNYRFQMEKYGVELKLNTPLTKEIVEAEKPDAVIIATGSKPLVLPIPGLDNGEFVKSAVDVLRGREEFGENVVVIGGGMTGTETAVFLAQNGCDVTIVEMAPAITADAVAQTKLVLANEIKKYGIKVHASTKLTRVGENAVYAEAYGEPVEFNRVDTVVNAMGVRSYNPLAEELKDCDCEVVSVGDANKTKNGYSNIREGFNAGNAI